MTIDLGDHLRYRVLHEQLVQQISQVNRDSLLQLVEELF